jgi:hypothetical protein
MRVKISALGYLCDESGTLLHAVAKNDNVAIATAVRKFGHFVCRDERDNAEHRETLRLLLTQSGGTAQLQFDGAQLERHFRGESGYERRELGELFGARNQVFGAPMKKRRRKKAA